MNTRRAGAFSLGLIGLLGVGYQASRARAAGIPTQTPLVYSGSLLNNGAPATGAHSIDISLWNDPTSTTSTNQVCHNPLPASVTPDPGGRFSIALDPACQAAVQANPDLFVQLIVDGTVLPRGKLGAVPYAVEAARASDAAGSLQATLASLQTQLAALQAKRPVFVNGSSSYSLDAKPCGALAASTGNLGGYGGAKTACEQACGSPTAHMCTGEEMVRFVATGGAPTSELMWVATGRGGQAQFSGLDYPQDDCGGYTSAVSRQHGLLWSSGSPGLTNCDSSLRTACCD